MARYRVTVEEITRGEDKMLRARPLHVYFADDVRMQPVEGDVTVVLHTATQAPATEPVLWICEHGKVRGEHCPQCLTVTTKES